MAVCKCLTTFISKVLVYCPNEKSDIPRELGIYYQQILNRNVLALTIFRRWISPEGVTDWIHTSAARCSPSLLQYKPFVHNHESGKTIRRQSRCATLLRKIGPSTLEPSIDKSFCRNQTAFISSKHLESFDQRYDFLFVCVCRHFGVRTHRNPASTHTSNSLHRVFLRAPDNFPIDTFFHEAIFKKVPNRFNQLNNQAQ